MTSILQEMGIAFDTCGNIVELKDYTFEDGEIWYEPDTDDEERCLRAQLLKSFKRTTKDKHCVKAKD